MQEKFEPSLAHRTIDGDKRRQRILHWIKSGDQGFRVGANKWENRGARAGTSDRRLRVTTRAAIAVEARSETGVCAVSDRLDFLKATLAVQEIVVGSRRGHGSQGAAGINRAVAHPRVLYNKLSDHDFRSFY